jgi:hypothetical protein
VETQASNLRLSSDDATSLGVALAESLSALLDARPAGRLRLTVSERGDHAEVAISEVGETGGQPLVSVSHGYLLRAMAEQLGAAVALRADAAGSALVLSVPRTPATETDPAATVH